MFARTCLREKRVERIISTTNSFVAWHLTIRLDAVLKTVQFPASIADLNTSLADVDTDTFTLKQGDV